MHQYPIKFKTSDSVVVLSALMSAAFDESRDPLMRLMARRLLEKLTTLVMTARIRKAPAVKVKLPVEYALAFAECTAHDVYLSTITAGLAQNIDNIFHAK